MAIYNQINLQPFFSNRGFTTADDQTSGALSLGGSSLPESLVPFDELFEIDSISFRFSRSDDGDNIEMLSQVIPFQDMLVKKIHVLGVSNNGDFFEWLHLRYNGTPVYKTKLYLSDFLSPRAVFNDRMAFDFPYLHSQSGVNEHFKPKIWMYSMEISDEPIANELQLADNQFMHIFAMTIEGEVIKKGFSHE